MEDKHAVASTVLTFKRELTLYPASLFHLTAVAALLSQDSDTDLLNKKTLNLLNKKMIIIILSPFLQTSC